MTVLLWILTVLALVIGAAVMLLVVHGARQAEIHQQMRNNHGPRPVEESSNYQEDNHG